MSAYVSDFWTLQDELDREQQRRDFERDVFEEEQRKSMDWERENGWVPGYNRDGIALADILDDIERQRSHRPRLWRFFVKAGRRYRWGIRRQVVRHG